MRQAAHQSLSSILVKVFVALLVSAVIMGLGGCSSSWRAPMETRSSGYPRAQQPPQKPRLNPLPTPRPAAKPIPLDAERYRVRAGDTLYSIAWRNDKDFRELALWNDIRKPYTIYKGQWLRLKPPRQARKPKSSSRDAKPASPPKRVKAQESKKTEPKVAAPKKRPQRKAGPLAWDWPYQGKVKATFKAGDRLRKGIKISGKPGAPVVAAESGKVVYSGSGLIGYGRLIIVKHNDKYLSAYGHNRKLLAKQGQQVTKGQQIAELGMSNDGTPLLHFEIRRNGKPVNPLKMLPRR